MLPDPQHPPSSRPKDRVCLGIPTPVGIDLARPILGVGTRCRVVCLAAMPEAAVQENGHTRSWKYHVGRARYVAQRPCTNPVPKAQTMRSRAQCHFRSGVPKAISLHCAPGSVTRCPRSRDIACHPFTVRALGPRRPHLSYGCQPARSAAGSEPTAPCDGAGGWVTASSSPRRVSKRSTSSRRCWRRTHAATIRMPDRVAPRSV
jgi:hypothetical protein